MEPHPFDNHCSTSLSSSFNNFADSDEDQQSEESSQDEDQQESSGSEFEEQPQKKSGKPVVIPLASHLCFQTPTDSLPQHFFPDRPSAFHSNAPLPTEFAQLTRLHFNNAQDFATLASSIAA